MYAHAIEYRPTPVWESLALLRTMMDLVTQCLSKQEDPFVALSSVIGGCFELRQTRLDDSCERLLGVSEGAAKRLLDKLDLPEGSDDVFHAEDTSEIVLVKALWALEARLMRISGKPSQGGGMIAECPSQTASTGALRRATVR